MKKRWLKAGALAVGAVLMATAFLTGCGNSDTAENGAAQLVVADTQCPTSLDLAESWDSWYTSRYGITETLYKLDDNLTPQPHLALSCDMVDETTWQITLRDDVTFQNGEKMTAEAVKACWERTAEKNARFNELLFIDSITDDGQTLTVTTTKPVPAFINGLSEPLTGIIDVSDEASIATQPIGTGPFMVTDYEVRGDVQLARYDGYWGGTPKIESAVYTVIADTNSLAMAQQTGESDVSVSMAGTSLSQFEDTSKYRVSSNTGSRGQIVHMNQDNVFLQDINVRKAISMSIDKENYANVLNNGASAPATGLYPDFMAYGADAGQGYAYDLDGARELLEQAGYTDSNGDGIREKDGQNLSLRIVTYSTKAELPIFADEMAAKLKEIGVDAKVEVYESVTEQEASGDFDLLLYSMTMVPTGDPAYFADLVLKSDGSSNYGHYSNAQVDALIDALDQEFDTARRTELTKEIQRLVLEDAGYIVIGHATYTYVMGNDVTGLTANPSEYYLMDANIALEGNA